MANPTNSIIRNHFGNIPVVGTDEATALNNLLDNWLNDPSTQGDKAEAKIRIIDAFKNKSTVLDLNNLGLTVVPTAALSYLTGLKFFWLKNNKLSNLTLPNLPNLSDLYLSDNPHLRELPLSLGQNPNLLMILCDEALRSQADRILAHCKTLRGSTAVNELPTTLRLWFSYCQTPITFSEEKKVVNFSDIEKTEMQEWLKRLCRTKDFASCQFTLAQTVCNIIRGAISNNEFRELFITQIQVNNTECQDRAAMALNELYLSYRILCSGEKASRQDLIQLLISGGKTQAFYEGLAQQINERQIKYNNVELESVEIFLYETIAHSEELGLLTAIRSMCHAIIGDREWIDKNKLKQYVEDHYAEKAIELRTCELLIDKDLGEKMALETIKKAEEYALNERPKGDDRSLEVLNWTIECNQKRAARDTAILAFKRQWLLNTIDFLHNL